MEQCDVRATARHEVPADEGEEGGHMKPVRSSYAGLPGFATVSASEDKSCA